MKRVMVMLLGVLIAMLLAMPVMAEIDATPVDMYTAPSNSGESGIDTQSPVLDGSAFTNYDTVFFHGAMAESNQGSYGVYRESDWANCHEIILNKSAGPVYVNCPYFSYDSKEGGIQPKVKYLGLQYKTYTAAEIYHVSIYNGRTWVKGIDFNPPLKSTVDYTIRVIDLGAWYRFDRGLNMCVWIRNPSTTYTGQVDIGGYGARFEW